MTRTAAIVAYESNGIHNNTVSIRLVLYDSALKTRDDITDAVKKAVKYYITQTSKGRATYQMNCGAFGWREFYNDVPNEICRRFGFAKEIESPDITIKTDLNEQLA